jgi:hypothetical protein
MLEEFAYMLNQGRKLELVPAGPLKPRNEDLVELIEKQMANSCNPEMSVTNILSKFFNVEAKRKSQRK